MFSAPLSSWLTTSLAVRNVSSPSFTDGGVKLGVGFKPHSKALLGISATPASGGGAVEVNARLRLWRGLSLELGWLGYEGAGYLNGVQAHPIPSAIASTSTVWTGSGMPSDSLWRFAR